MAVPTITSYGLYLQSLLEGRVNLLVDEVWVMLVGNGYTFNKNTHKFKSIVTGEIVGSGYTAGGQKVAFTGPTYDSTTSSAKATVGNSAWPSVTFIGAVGAVIYVKPYGITSEGAMPLVAYVAFGESISRSAQAFYINWPASGILKLTAP